MSKAAKIINLIIQTLGFVLIIIALFNFKHDFDLVGYTTRNFFDEIKLFVIVAESLFFIYQFFHAGITTILKLSAKKFTVVYKIFWLSVLGFLLAAVMLAYYAEANELVIGEEVFTTWFLAFWSVILFYYFISLNEVVNAYKES